MKEIAKYIAENSSPEDVDKNILNYAISIHGKEKVEQELMSASPDAADDVMRRLVTEQKDIPENNEYIQGLYKGIENLGYGPAKIAAHIATPLLEAARAPFKYIAENVGENTSQTPPIDTTAEFTQSDWYGLPSNRATASNILTDISNAMGIKQAPLARVDIEGYPKASEALTQLTNPAVAGGIAVDTVLASGKVPFTKYNVNTPISSIPAEAMSGLTKRPLMSLETAADYIRSLAKDRSQLLELEKSGRIYELANMVRNDPEKYLHQFRPNKVYENITGKIKPGSATRDIQSGELYRLNSLQDEAINNIPGVTDTDMATMQANALNNLPGEGDILPSQRSRAEDLIKEIIPVVQPDKSKLERIRKIGDLSSEYKKIRDTHPDEIPNPNYREDLQWLSGIESVEPNFTKQIPNPKYREDLQWLSKLPVVEGETFPRNYVSNETTINTPDFDPYRLNSYTDESKINLTKETYSTMSEIPKDQGGFKNQKILDIIEGKHNEPRFIDKPSDPFSTTEKRVDIAMGKQKEPKFLPNQEKITKLAELEQQIKDLGGLDPHGSSPEAYMDYINEMHNFKSPQMSSKIRQLSNKLVDLKSLSADPLDTQAKAIAGKAIQKAAHDAQDIQMAAGDVSWKDIARYNDRNRSISNNLLLRDLFEGNLVADNYGGTEYLPSSMTGKTGGIGFVAKAKNRFIKPTIGPTINQAYNLGVDMAQGMGKYAGVNMALGNNLLNEYKLPRSHEEFIAELPMVQKKLSSVMGEEAANQAISQLQSSPQEFYDKLPLIENQLPGLFKYDRYRRVNGRIFDPTLKALAEKEILNSTMSNSEKMMKQSMLLKSGLYDGI